MVYERRYQNRSVSSADNTNNELGMSVVIGDRVYRGAGDMSQVKQEPSDLENIIMEGDIILKIHDSGDNDDNSQKEFQAVTSDSIEHSILYEHHDDTLVKVGDCFQSNKDFVKYVNENAKRWCFYYKCTEAQNVDTENEAYTYCCVYLKNRDYTKKKGSKKRNNCKTDCPCKVKLRRKPGEALKVIYVCNHHDHELSKEDFYKFQNSKKLSPYIKEIIMDLLALEVEIGKIRKFVEMETGMKMSRTYFYEMEKKMKSKHEERQITDKRLKELSSKMSVVDEMFSGDEDENTDDQNSTKKKRLKLSTTGGIVCKFAEDVESTKNSEWSAISDAQTSWMSDQPVSAPNETLTTDWDETTITATTDIDHEPQEYTDIADTAVDNDYTDEYTVEETTETTTTEEMATKTVQQTDNTFSQYESVVLQDEFGNVINCENDEQIVILQQDENGVVQGENGTIGYFDGEQIIYMVDENQQNEQNQQNESSESSIPCDTAVQTSSNTKPGHSYVPVFDVYMKNGNVTGFVVNDKEGKEDQSLSPEKGQKSPQDPGPDESQHSENPTEVEPLCEISTSNATQEFMCGDTYTKHEYIHRYNIDQYMANPQFPKFIDTLAKKTHTDVMHMLSRLYNEKAMFKMTTTQKGKEGNTKIWYLSDVRRKGKYKLSEEEKMKRDQTGQYLTDILILKERVKSLKKENDELRSRNRYLEEVALRLAKMNEHN